MNKDVCSWRFVLDRGRVSVSSGSAEEAPLSLQLKVTGDSSVHISCQCSGGTATVAAQKSLLNQN